MPCRCPLARRRVGRGAPGPQWGPVEQACRHAPLLAWGMTSVTNRSRASKVEGRPQTEVDPVGPGVLVLADLVDDLGRRSRRAIPPSRVGAASPNRRRSSSSTSRSANTSPTLTPVTMRCGAGACVEDDRRASGRSPPARRRGCSSRRRAGRRAAAPACCRCTDPDPRDVLHRLGVAAGVGEGEELALELGDVLGPEEADHLDRLGEAAEPGGRVIRTAGRRPRYSASCHPAPMPSSRRPPERWSMVTRGVGEHGRVPVSGAVHERPDPHAARARPPARCGTRPPSKQSRSGASCAG